MKLNYKNDQFEIDAILSGENGEQEYVTLRFPEGFVPREVTILPPMRSAKGGYGLTWYPYFSAIFEKISSLLRIS